MLENLICSHKVDCLILAEPRTSGNTVDKVIRRLRFDHVTKVDALAFSGGIWVLWKTTFDKVEVVSKGTQFITTLVTGGNGIKWYLTWIYAILIPSIRHNL